MLVVGRKKLMLKDKKLSRIRIDNTRLGAGYTTKVVILGLTKRLPISQRNIIGFASRRLFHLSSGTRQIVRKSTLPVSLRRITIIIITRLRPFSGPQPPLPISS